jgi:hypothetical protein
MNLLALDHVAHHAQQWVTPELGLNSTGQGIPRLGKDNREVAQNNMKDFIPGATYIHNPQTLIPHMQLFHPRRVHLHYYKSIDYYTSLSLGFNNRLDRKSQSTVAATRLPP